MEIFLGVVVSLAVVGGAVWLVLRKVKDNNRTKNVGGGSSNSSTKAKPKNLLEDS